MEVGLLSGTTEIFAEAIRNFIGLLVKVGVTCGFFSLLGRIELIKLVLCRSISSRNLFGECLSLYYCKNAGVAPGEG